MYAKLFRKAHQTRRFTISDDTPHGWEVRDEVNDAVVRRARYDDWHRVERARAAFAVEAMQLRSAGWVES